MPTTVREFITEVGAGMGEMGQGSVRAAKVGEWGRRVRRHEGRDRGQG